MSGCSRVVQPRPVPDRSSGLFNVWDVHGRGGGHTVGPVQVRITVKNGKIIKSEAVVYLTENGRDQEINACAVPPSIRRP